MSPCFTESSTQTTKKVVKVVKVKMVIFIFGLCHLLTIIINIYIYFIVVDFDNAETILTKWPWPKWPQDSCKKLLRKTCGAFVDRNGDVVPLHTWKQVSRHWKHTKSNKQAVLHKTRRLKSSWQFPPSCFGERLLSSPSGERPEVERSLIK